MASVAAEARRVSDAWLEQAEAKALQADADIESDSSEDGVFVKRIAEADATGDPVDPYTATAADFHELLGATVVLHGLKAKPELNGALAVRWAVARRCSSRGATLYPPDPIVPVPRRLDWPGHVVARQHRTCRSQGRRGDARAQAVQPCTVE